MKPNKSLASLQRQYTEPSIAFDATSSDLGNNNCEISHLENFSSLANKGNIFSQSSVGSSFLERSMCMMASDSFILSNGSKFKNPVANLKINLSEKVKTVHSYFSQASSKTDSQEASSGDFAPKNVSCLNLITPNTVYPLKTRPVLPPITNTNAFLHTARNFRRPSPDRSGDETNPSDSFENSATSSELEFRSTLPNMHALKFLSVDPAESAEEYTQLNSKTRSARAPTESSSWHTTNWTTKTMQ